MYVSDEELIHMVGGRDELRLLLFDHGALLPQWPVAGLIPSLYVLELHSTKNIQEIKI